MKRIFTSQWPSYELLDAGNGKKLERWGNVVTIRPEKNAYFTAMFSNKQWRQKAHFEFVEQTSSQGCWQILKRGTPTQWTIKYKNLIFNLRLTQFKHIGIFPEQVVNWEYIASQIQKENNFLNLFAYTGGSSLVARDCGAKVYHCDSIKQVVSWAKENMDSSSLTDIHWILEDALKFALREVKRKKLYNGIIMDPPAFGLGRGNSRGNKKQRWKIETLFPELIKAASKLLTANGFLIINTYSPKLNEDKIKLVVDQYFEKRKIEISKLCIRSTTGKIIEYGELTRIC